MVNCAWKKHKDIWNKRAGKKIGAVCAILLFTVFAAGCTLERTEIAEEDEKLQIMCTTFPLYDWTRQVTSGCEDSIEVTLLMDQGTDPHNYQPTTEDIVRMTEADIIVYVGGESDLWMEDVLASVPEGQREMQKYLNMMEVLGPSLREEEQTEGMQGSVEGQIHEAAGDEENHTDKTEYDEHIWLSVKNAAVCVQAVADAVADLEESARLTVEKNTAEYLAELEKLDEQYETMISQAPFHRVLFADRFPFLYLMKDYGLEYDAAFPGCSTETEASFETVIYLAGRLEEYHLPAVLVMENGDRRIAETVIDNTADKDQSILALNSMQSVTVADIEHGASYLSIMRENLAVLQEALAYK